MDVHWFKDIALPVMLIIGLIGGIIGLALGADTLAERFVRQACYNRGEILNLPVWYTDRQCHYEVCPNLWLQETDILYNLDVIRDCQRPE